MKKLNIKNTYKFGFLIAVFALISFILPTHRASASISIDGLVQQTNQQRIANGLQPLTVNQNLVQSANLKGSDMATYGYFAHTSPQGKNPWYFVSAAGYKYVSAGENLAVDFTDTSAVMTAWMNSPTHRANIMAPQFTEIGIAVVQGTYQGHSVYFVVQHFGRPATLVSTASAVLKTASVAPKATSSKTTTVTKASAIKPVAKSTVKKTTAVKVAKKSTKKKVVATKATANKVIYANGKVIASAPTNAKVAGAQINLTDTTTRQIPYFFSFGMLALALGITPFAKHAYAVVKNK